jgi:hypothetical protein
MAQPWFELPDGDMINLDQAIKIAKQGDVITVVFTRGVTQRIPLEFWDQILDTIGAAPTPHK